MNTIRKYGDQSHHSPVQDLSSRKNESPCKIIFDNLRFAVTSKMLGEGGSGVVMRGIAKYSESPVAVKTVSDRVSAQVEVAGLQFDIPHTVRYRGEFEQADEYSIVMDEVVGKNIAEAFLSPDGSALTLLEMQSIIVQLFEILEDLEDKNLINYDIKPENLIWNRASGSLTLVDLASIRQIDEACDVEPHVTIEYLAPEWILGGEIDCSYSTWSAACTIFELIVGQKLFTKHRQQIEEYDFILLQIVQQLGKPNVEYLKKFDRTFVCFDENITCKDKWHIPPQEPWSDRLKQALLAKGACDEDVAQWTELLGSMLRYEDRASAKSLLTNPLGKNVSFLHLVYDRMNACQMQLRRASKAGTVADITIDLKKEKNCCIHFPRDPNNQYILIMKKGTNEVQKTITIEAGAKLDVFEYQSAVEPAKKRLFVDE